MASATLAAFPVALFRAFDEQSAGLLREYTLTLLGGSDQPFDLDDVARVQGAKAAVTAGLDSTLAGLGIAGAAEAKALDVRLDCRDAAAFGLLQGVLDHANVLARMGELLVLPALPEVAALRNWMCDQVITQSSGARAVGWRLPDGPMEMPGGPLAVWDGLSGLPLDQAWLVGDDSNRIIGASPPALELLGWKADELIGERIVAVIPTRLRELHVAAFTRGVLTGHYSLLDQPLPLSAQTRDGREVDITLTLHQHKAARGRTVFLAHLDRR